MATKIAIVGVGLKVPGAEDLDGLWQLLQGSEDALGEVPEDRWDASTLHSTQPGAPGKISCPRGGFLPQIDHFDARHFGISPREAREMDPQQRLLLHVAWAAMEDAAVRPSALRGSSTGVFVGIHSFDYLKRRFQGSALSEIGPWLSTGNSHSIAANRLSWCLDLKGPSVALDTACSSSLVAVHLACQSLARGESDHALAGGVNLILSPEISVALSQARMLSPTGRCAAFDVAADGYVRSEGCILLLLRRLSDALRDGDPIHAVISGSAVTQDGHTRSLSSPDPGAQARAIRQSIAAAGLHPGDISYVEAHGTGTPVGDPIELEGLAEVFGERRGDPLPIGSVKAHLGHLETAAGAAGLLKALLCLRHREVPAQIHAGRPLPALTRQGGPLRLVVAPLPLPEGAHLGVSSFGFGGTNAHMVLAPAPASPRAAPLPPGPLPFVLSAATPGDLQRLAAMHHASLLTHRTLSYADVATTLWEGRELHSHRVGLVARDQEDLREKLAALDEDEALLAQAGQRHNGRTLLLFSGQGSTWAGMGRELYHRSQVFQRTLDEIDALCRQHLPGPLLSAMFGESAMLNTTLWAQPALFALQAGLVKWLEAAGLRADAVLGHSVGEIAAAWLSGHLSLEEATRLACGRGAGMQLCPAGAMLAVGASRAQLMPWLDGADGEVEIAAFNAEQSLTLAGATGAINRIEKGLQFAGLPVRRLPVDRAFHSQHIELCLPLLEGIDDALPRREPTLTFYSTSTGGALRGPLPERYWTQQARRPVLFEKALREALGDGCDLILEIAPRPTLAPLARAASRAGTLVLPIMAQGDDNTAPADALARLWCLGAVGGGTSKELGLIGRRIHLPGLALSGDSHWVEATQARTAPAADGPALRWRPVPSATPGVLLATHAAASESPAIRDHQLRGVPTVPAALWMTLLHSSCQHLQVMSSAASEDVHVEAPLRLGEGETRALQLHAHSLHPTPTSCVISSASGEGPFTRHVSARVGPAGPPPPALDLGTRLKRLNEVEVSRYYGVLAQVGLEYGPSLRRARRVWQRPGEALVELSPPPEGEAEVGLTPEALDGALQAVAATLMGSGLTARTYVPIGWRRARTWASGAAASFAWLKTTRATEREALTDVWVTDEEGNVLLQVEGYHTRTLPQEQERTPSPFYAIEWEEQPLALGEVGPRTLLLEGDKAAVLALRERIRRTAGGAAPLRLHGDASSQDEEVTDLVYVAPRRPVTSLGEEAQEQATALLEWLRDTLPFHPSARVWLVTAGAFAVGSEEPWPPHTALEALTRNALLESPGAWGRCVDISPGLPVEEILPAELSDLRAEARIAHRPGRRCAARLRRLEESAEPPPPSLTLPEDFTRRAWSITPGVDPRVPELSPLPIKAPAGREVLLRVMISGLGFRDVMCAAGLYPDAPPWLGSECVGEVAAIGPEVEHLSQGQVVMGLAPAALSSFTLTREELCVPVPAGLPLHEAAGIPVAFLTAWYALKHVARLAPGERVLIHSATGALGQAAIQITHLLGGRVLATSSREDRLERLRSQRLAGVFNSRAPDAPAQIRAATGGQGVDVVLSALPSPWIEEGLGLLAPLGRYVELGKTDLVRDTAVGLRAFSRGVSLTAVDLGQLCSLSPERIRGLWAELTPLFRAGSLTPVETTPVPLMQLPAALRKITRRQHLGKLVMLHPGSSAPESSLVQGVWILTGASGGLGSEVAQWLARRRLQHLIVVTRAPMPSSLRAALDEHAPGRWSHLQADVSLRGEVTRVVELARQRGPLRGVYHLAGRLADGTLERQGRRSIEATFAPKVQGAWHLHEATLDDSLFEFVMFSSVASSLGSPAQTSYAAANAFLDGLAHLRRSQGRAGLSIGWGPWAQVGMAAQKGWIPRMAELGVDAHSPSAALTLLEQALSLAAPAPLLLRARWDKVEAVVGSTPASRQFLAFVLPGAGSARPEQLSALLQALYAMSHEERVAQVSAALRREVAQVLGVAASELNDDLPLTDQGLDSLLALELRERLERALGSPMALDKMMVDPSLGELVALILARAERVTPPEAPPEGAP